MDNEVNELVEDVVDVLNQKDYNIIELLKIKQFQAQRIAELEEQLKNAIVPKFKGEDEILSEVKVIGNIYDNPELVEELK